MTFKKCNSCGGVYAPVQADGAVYFHACAPLPQFFDHTGLPISSDMAGSLLKAGSPVYRKDVERANKRDENLNRPASFGQAATMKAAGDGAVDYVAPVDALAGAVLISGANPLVP